MEEIVSHSLEETREAAHQLAEQLMRRPEAATVLAFSGPLGAGKTSFIRALLRFLGVTGPVTSPTYTIETVYSLEATAFAHAFHIDAYRLEGAADLEALEFASRLENPANLILVEWSGQVDELLPEDAIHIDIAFGDVDTERVITISHE